MNEYKYVKEARKKEMKEGVNGLIQGGMKKLMKERTNEQTMGMNKRIVKHVKDDH